MSVSFSTCVSVHKNGYIQHDLETLCRSLRRRFSSALRSLRGLLVALRVEHNVSADRTQSLLVRALLASCRVVLRDLALHVSYCDEDMSCG